MRPTSSIISLDQVSIGYGTGRNDKKLVQNLDLTVSERQLIVLVGPNGVGKSTLLRTIAGLQKPLCGSIQLFNKPTNNLNPKMLAHYVSVVLTSQIDTGYVTASELIAMGRLPHTGWLGTFSSLDRQKVSSAVKQTKVDHLLDKPVYQLSDGERQKIMIARALAQDTPIMILDEPTTHLDITNQMNIIQLLRSLVKTQNKCIILATHNIELALQVSDRMWLMHHGTMEDGTPEDLVLNGALAQAMSTDLAPFNPERGTFQVQHSSTYPIVLKGTGIRAHWTQRALERAGYYVQNEGAVAVEIADEDDWLIYHNNQFIRSVDSIGSLLYQLSQLYSSSSLSHPDV